MEMKRLRVETLFKSPGAQDMGCSKEKVRRGGVSWRGLNMRVKSGEQEQKGQKQG